MNRAMMLAGVVCVLSGTALGTPDFVQHFPDQGVFGSPGDVTQREPEVPREDEGVDLWVRIGFSFFYTDVAVYYTTDGTEPSGSFGVGAGTTQVLRSDAGQVTFVRNEPNVPNNIDWWRGTLPASTRSYGTQVRYKISAWNESGGPEVFANNTGCADGFCDNPAGPASNYTFTTKLAWPGQGSAFPNDDVGYPPVHVWKEEGIIGNNYINVQLDQNGSLYDVYYPSAGCVQGVSTKNEGYNAPEEFPAGIPDGNRGQMHLNQAFGGVRVDGKTYWLTNQLGADYTAVTQSYLPGTNTIVTSQRLVADGNDILVQQYDFSPKGIAFPTDDGGQPNRGLSVKRMVLTNQGASTESVNVYFYMDPALNGGDSFDSMFTDPARGAMVAYDNTFRNTSSSGEYNPTFFSGYDKNVSVYLGAAMKVLPQGANPGAIASDFWSDTSGDIGQGWMGVKVTLPPGVAREVNVLIVGGFDPFAGASGTYNFQMDGPIDWFQAQNMSALQATTDAYWQNWLAGGVTVDLPNQDLEVLYNRGLLSTALHLDGAKGGLIAGYHNGAYPFVWPRDAVYGAISLAKTGHTDEAKNVYRFLRDITFRGNESWGKGFWYQKYTTDGYRVWTAPQIDETAVAPWGVKQYIDVTGDTGFLSEASPTIAGNDTYKLLVQDAGFAMSSDSANDSRAYFDDTFLLMHGNNIWEDSFDLFIYTNANVVRGLRDAAALATLHGIPADATTFHARADTIKFGLESRIDWNGENTDISLLGVVYPFQVIDPTSPRATLILDRIRGIQPDRFGSFEPLVNSAGPPWLPEFVGLVNRYWGDGYWVGGPWHLSTAWYGLFHAERADYTAGKADIDDHTYRMSKIVDALGPLGLGAEQIAPNSGLLYGGQTDFRHQTAWPNAWESMSTFVDCVMAYLDAVPDAVANKLTVSPKLPTGWGSMTFNNVRVGPHRVNVTAREGAGFAEIEFANTTGQTLNVTADIRVPAGSPVCQVTRNGAGVAYTSNPSIGKVTVNTTISGASVVLRVATTSAADANGDGQVNGADLSVLLATFGTSQPAGTNGDLNGDGIVNGADLSVLLAGFGSSCQ